MIYGKKDLEQSWTSIKTHRWQLFVYLLIESSQLRGHLGRVVMASVSNSLNRLVSADGISRVSSNLTDVDIFLEFLAGGRPQANECTGISIYDGSTHFS